MLAAASRRLASPAARAGYRAVASVPPGGGDAAPTDDGGLAAALASLATATAPQKATLGTHHAGLGDLVRDGLRWARARAATILTAAHVETSFDAGEFVEGAKDAYYMCGRGRRGEGGRRARREEGGRWCARRRAAPPPPPPPRVNAAFGEGDWASLRPGLAPSLLTALQGVHRAYADAGLALALAVDPTSLHAGIADMAVLGGTAAADGDGAGDAGEADDQRTPTHAFAGGHQVLAVRFTGVITVAVHSLASGTLVQELTDARPHVWRFARGPLPSALPARDLGLPWTLMAID